MIIKAKNILIILIIIILIIIGVFGIKNGVEKLYKINYPLKYSESVEKYATENNIDKFLIYAIIKTESDFKSDAVSSVGARGLMQIMPTTYDWIKSKQKNDTTTYDDMFTPDINIKYGSYLIASHYNEFNNIESAIAAYHAGRGAVSNWLSTQEYSKDGIILSEIPIKDTKHYVHKVMKCYDIYKKIY